MIAVSQTTKSFDSEWQPQAPLDWEVVKLRSLAKKGLYTFIDGDWIESPYITDDGIRLIQTGNIGIGKYVEQGFRYVSAETFSLLDCTEVAPGDVLICRLAAPVGRACIAPFLDKRMITSVDVCILKTDEETDPRYLVYFLSSSFYLGWMEVISRGSTRDRVSRSQLGVTHVFKPPLTVQETIAAFLDEETSRIDALISKKEMQIELLQEKRQAIITHAVTKGLDPSAKMKDSGVEWIGEIPNHWQLRRLRHIAAELGVGVVVNPSQYVADEGLPFLYGSDISEGHISTEHCRRISDEDSKRLPKSRLRQGDLVMVRVGAPGTTAVVPPELEGANCASVLLIRMKPNVHSEWLCYALNSRYVRSQVEAVQYGAAQEQFNVSHAVNFAIPVPPFGEQQAIAHLVRNQSAFINEAIAKIEKSSELLQEYRSSLITAAVSGQIDISKMKAKAPE